MVHSIKRLTTIASEPIAPKGKHDNEYSALFKAYGEPGKELACLLEIKNGFYAYESALLVRPYSNLGKPIGLLEWNNATLWRSRYTVDLGKFLFFAEDIFGFQFAISKQGAHRFDPESGLLEKLCQSINEWCEIILHDYEFLTGYRLAHEWQMKYGPLTPGCRLIPQLPFVCGGQLTLENLVQMEDMKAILFRANIANQIKDLPDGSKIKFELRE